MIRRGAVLAGLALTLIGFAPDAHADGQLSSNEQSLGDAMSDEVCEYFYDNGVSQTNVTHVLSIIGRQRGINSKGDAVDVLNYILKNYCPD